MPQATIQGLTLHYTVAGSGEPLVLLMGQSTGPAGRDDLLKSLAQHYTVITHDQRGTGRSQKVPEGASIATLAADVIGLMDFLGLDKVPVVSFDRLRHGALDCLQPPRPRQETHSCGPVGLCR